MENSTFTTVRKFKNFNIGTVNAIIQKICLAALNVCAN